MVKRPFDILAAQNEYSATEIGLTHPKLPSYIKFADNGDIYLMAKAGLGIIISPSQDAIILVAETIKLLTKEGDGFKWNEQAFNPKATSFSEPTLVDVDKKSLDIYDGFDDFLD
jgi:hypothetical protein